MSESLWVEHALAQHALEEGNVDEAIRLLESVKERRPDHAVTYLTLAAAYARAGDADRFQQNIETYRSLNPSHHVASLYLGEAHFRQDNLLAATEAFQAYLAEETGADAKSLHRREYALGRLAEIAGREGRTSNELHFAARRHHQAALAALVDAHNARVTPEVEGEIRNHLRASLDAYQQLATHADAGDITSEQATVASLMGDLDDGRIEHVARLLATVGASSQSDPALNR